MKLTAKVGYLTDPDGIVRWSTSVEDLNTNTVLCSLLSVDSLHAAEGNAQQLFRLITALAGQTLDVSAWPIPYR